MPSRRCPTRRMVHATHLFDVAPLDGVQPYHLVTAVLRGLRLGQQRRRVIAPEFGRAGAAWARPHVFGRQPYVSAALHLHDRARPRVRPATECRPRRLGGVIGVGRGHRARRARPMDRWVFLACDHMMRTILSLEIGRMPAANPSLRQSTPASCRRALRPRDPRLRSNPLQRRGRSRRQRELVS